MDYQAVWNQDRTAVIWLRGAKLLIRLPKPRFRGIGRWLQGGERKRMPVFDKTTGSWTMLRSRLNDVASLFLERYGRFYLIQSYRRMEKCAPACMKAKGLDCECSCLGENHGSDSGDSWFEVSETFAFRWQDEDYSCRLVERSKSANEDF